VDIQAKTRTLATTAALAVIATLGSSTAVSAQAGGRLVGVVLDQTGAAVPGARLDISCDARRDVVTASPTGEFEKTALPGGSCRISASADAFETETLVAGTSGRPLTIVLRVRTFAQEVVVTPSRGFASRAANVPESISVTSRRDIETRPHQLLPQVLQEEAGVLLQQTTSAQTSPIIRGFTGQSNIYLLDGVRLNVSSWRSGPGQYTAWVDSGPIESIEVVRGGGSVQYGSDALAGHRLPAPYRSEEPRPTTP
jgi:outer membrane receptor protein involved in Fe transport